MNKFEFQIIDFKNCNNLWEFTEVANAKIAPLLERLKQLEEMERTVNTSPLVFYKIDGLWVQSKTPDGKFVGRVVMVEDKKDD